MDGLALYEVNTSVSGSGKLAGHSRDDYYDSSIVLASIQRAEREPRPTATYPLTTTYLLLFLQSVTKCEELHPKWAYWFYLSGYYYDDCILKSKYICSFVFPTSKEFGINPSKVNPCYLLLKLHY